MAKAHKPFFICMFLSILLHFSIIAVLCQSPASSPAVTPPATLAPAPAPSGPPNITAILEKARQFTTMIRLLKSTQVGDRIYVQLNTSNQGLTVFAPSDSAFSALKSGTLNSLKDEEQVNLILFHILPSFIPLTQFQTVSNPLRTQAGDSGNYHYPLNVTTLGNQVNISTGIDNTTVINTIYSDNQLAVYQVDKVLLPLDLFGPKPPTSAPAPAEANEKKKKSSASAIAPSSDDASGDMYFNPNAAVSLVATAIAIFGL